MTTKVSTPATVGNRSASEFRNKLGAKFKITSKRGPRMLKRLGFDPMQELVAKYRDLEAELVYHQQLRDGTKVELDHNGDTVAYEPSVHLSIYDKLLRTADSLMRYKYARVPENEGDEGGEPKLIINLTARGDGG